MREQLSAQVYSETLAGVRQSLRHQGIDFEGKELPLSLLPTVLTKADVGAVAQDGALIRGALETLLAVFLREHGRGELDGRVHRFFKPYERWWDLIATEVRQSPQIGLMRFDTVREPNGRWRFLENNTACPGGTIACARLREAWLATAFGQTTVATHTYAEHPIDSPFGFARFLARKVRQVSGGKTSNIALCSFRGSYLNELKALQAAHRELVDKGEVDGGEVIICDLRDLREENGQITAAGTPVTLIHNKIDQMMIDPFDPELVGWRAAAARPDVEFLNGLGALYLTEAKRSLALLSDPQWWSYLELSASTLAAIRRRIPATRLALPTTRRTLERRRAGLVLKSDALTRGAGVFVGSRLTPDKWAEALDEVMATHGVYQEAADTPRRVGYRLADDGALVAQPEYFGVDLFYFDGEFAGAVSRCHTDLVFNVGNGGKESPTVILS